MSEAAEIRTIRVATGENKLSLEEMSEALPDTATIMTRVGECWWHLAYAARGNNWDLAEYYFRRVRKLGITLATLRPKHAERIVRFQEEALAPLLQAIGARDLAALEAAYQVATDMANEMHSESGYPFIRWELPAEPPKGLALGPVTSAISTPTGNGQIRGQSE
jgi:hypothetical protein